MVDGQLKRCLGVRSSSEIPFHEEGLTAATRVWPGSAFEASDRLSCRQDAAVPQRCQFRGLGRALSRTYLLHEIAHCRWHCLVQLARTGEEVARDVCADVARPAL